MGSCQLSPKVEGKGHSLISVLWTTKFVTLKDRSQSSFNSGRNRSFKVKVIKLKINVFLVCLDKK